jgi:hypothetical protein
MLVTWHEGAELRLDELARDGMAAKDDAHIGLPQQFTWVEFLRLICIEKFSLRDDANDAAVIVGQAIHRGLSATLNVAVNLRRVAHDV